ncbi:MAG: glycoside hydrolase family 101 beta sandwich domain-containing protein [Candidatus Limousia pullorum]|nr:glycoside hydrolase family 101 beta sandwich domain-containing protein [Candidatus Limousia pullorum]
MFVNENAADFMRFGAWVHSTANNSQIHQFTYNSQKDIYPASSIYWGGYSRAASMMSWQHNNNINTLVEQFYTNQLPQKYLMCHDVERVANGVGYLSDNITSGNYTITKDGKKLTDGAGKIFIPWYDEDTSVDRNPDEAAKIYHWNSDGGKTTCDLPDSWSDVTTVYLYRTTQNGKTDETPIRVLEESYSAGHHKYTFTTGDKNDYIARIERSSVLDNFKVYLTDEVTGIDIENKEIEMSVGDTLTLNPTIQPVEANNKQVLWNTDENDIVSVDRTGKLVAVAKGTTTITGTTVEGGYTVTVTVTVNDKEYAKGDVNHDGVFNIDDATLIQQFLVGLNPDNFDQTLADMNGDGVININDATLIQLAIKA